MNLRSLAGDMRRKILSLFYRRTVPLGDRGPIVTFSFDDFPRTALTVGGEILEAFGARATYYVAMSLMNTRNTLGEQFRHEDLRDLLERGHELGSHTFSHLSALKAGYHVFQQDAERGEAAIRQTMAVSPSGSFAYPYGAVTLAAKKRLGSRLKSCRGTCGGLNGPDVDLNLLRANSLYGNRDKCAQVQDLIMDNERRRTWLIFYSHDVQQAPSRFGCTPELLEFAASFASQRNSRILTVSEVVAELSGCRQDDRPQLSRAVL